MKKIRIVVVAFKKNGEENARSPSPASKAVHYCG